MNQESTKSRIAAADVAGKIEPSSEGFDSVVNRLGATKDLLMSQVGVARQVTDRVHGARPENDIRDRPHEVGNGLLRRMHVELNEIGDLLGEMQRELDNLRMATSAH